MTQATILSFINDNWLNLLLFILGGIVTWIIFIKQRNERNPVFHLFPQRVEIISGDYLPTAPITVVDQNGNHIKDHLTAIYLYFWNRGKKAIRRENIIEQLIISTNDENAKFLDARLVKISNSYTKIKIVPTTNFPSQSFGLDFEVMDQDDGCVIQIFLLGKKTAKINAQGKIEGVKSNITNKTIGLLHDKSETSIYWVRMGYTALITGIIYFLVKVTMGYDLMKYFTLLFFCSLFLVVAIQKWLPMPYPFSTPKALR